MSESGDDDLGLDPDDRVSAETLRDRRRTRRLRRALRVPVDEVPRPAGRAEDAVAPPASGRLADDAAGAVVVRRSSVIAARIVTISAAPLPMPPPRPALTDSGDELDVDLEVDAMAEPPPSVPTARGIPGPARMPRESFDAELRSVEVPLDSSLDELDTIPPAAENEPTTAVMPRAPRMPELGDDGELARLSTPDLTDVLVEEEGRPTPIPDLSQRPYQLPAPPPAGARAMTPPPPPPRPPSIPPPAATSVRAPSIPPPPPTSTPPSITAVPVLSEALLGDSTPPPALGASPIASGAQASAHGAAVNGSHAAPSVAISGAIDAPPPAPPPVPSPPAAPSQPSSIATPPTAPIAAAAASALGEHAEPSDSLDPNSDITSQQELPAHEGVEAHDQPTVPRKKKRRHKPWWDEFFNDDYLRTFAPPTTEQTRRHADFIDDSLGLAAGANVLDLGCGQGRHAIEMAARGYKVVGLDLSIPMLATAGELAQEAGVKLNFIHGDMREMTFEATFDGIFCFETTFGFFDDEVNRDVIARVHKALRPGGMLLLDVVNRDFVMRHQPNLVWFEGDGCVCMEETDMNYITSRLLVKRTIILEDGRQKQSEYSIRLYSLHELGQLLHNLGFRVAEVSGRLTTPGVFFGAESPRLVILAEKRAASDFGGGGTGTGLTAALPGGQNPSANGMPAVTNPTTAGSRAETRAADRAERAESANTTRETPPTSGPGPDGSGQPPPTSD